MGESVQDGKMFDALIRQIVEQGAERAALVPVSQIELNEEFRALCASNACGKFGKCWMCPPDIGDIHVLMDSIRSYDWVLVYQTIGALEDSYDIEGMEEAALRHSRLTRKVVDIFREAAFQSALHLGAGGCHVCEVCARVENAPCRYPELAISSLEAHGINVSELAKAAGMRYINGQNTVTFFGAVFCTI